MPDNTETAPAKRPTVHNMNTGSTRVTVAFPFSKIEIQGPDPLVADLAGLVLRLARALDALAGPDNRPADLDALIEQARSLADRAGA